MTANFAHFGTAAPAIDVDLSVVRRNRSAKEIVRAWRALTGSRRTLIACSGGADSTALLLAIAAREPGAVVVGHVVHDMRPALESRADRDSVARLADRLGVGFIEREVHIPEGNVEAGARAVRHEALESMATESGCGFVATGHHADDQLESILLALGRGAGLRGLRGVVASRPLRGGEVQLVRPMLRVTRSDAERICRDAGVAWREDATNRDESRRRAALRRRVLPALQGVIPSVSSKSADAAAIIADAAGVIEDRANAIFGDGRSWARATLKQERRIVIGEGLRLAFGRLRGGVGLDRLPRREIEKAIDAIRDDQTHERRFAWPGAVTLVVGAGLVTMRRESEGTHQ